jgi:putative oxidoreductase
LAKEPTSASVMPAHWKTLIKQKEKIMKNVVKRILSTPDDRSIGLIALRIFTGIALMTHGYGKVFGNPESFVVAVENIGFPFPSFFAFAASFSEFFGGLLLSCGFFTRVWAFFIACTMGVAAFIVLGSAPFAQKELALLYLFVALFFMIKGGGTFSIDYLLGRKLDSKN